MSSYVDPIINAAVISQIDLRRDLASLVKLDFPEIYLPTFLHECTHHACFASPLGTALALLRMRAYRRATHLRTEPEGDHRDLLEDVLRQEVLMEILRPLAEGLACFAELDSIPGKSNVITQPMISTFFNFGGLEHELRAKEAVTAHDINLFLFELLFRARMSPDLAQRRENVLAGRFPLEFGGHLAGYMSIKSIWMRARTESDAAADPELFSSFVRSFIYDDYGLLAHLLDFGLTEYDAANAIATYFHKRLKQLLSLNWDASLAEFEKHFGRSEISGLDNARLILPRPGGIGTEPGPAALGTKRLEKLVSEVTGEPDPNSLEDLMRAYDWKRIRKRELLCLGSLDAEIEVNAHQRVKVTARDGDQLAEMPTASVPVLEGVARGSGRGSLEFYLIPNENARVAAIVRGHELVHVHFEGPISEERQEQVKSLFGTRAKDLEVIRQQEENLEAVIGGDSISVTRDHVKGAIPQVAERLYGWLATLSVAPDRWQSTAKLLSEGGVFELCGGDAELVSGLAFLGVASSVCHDKAELVSKGDEQAIDVEAICAKLKDIEAATGLPLIIDTEGKLLAII